VYIHALVEITSGVVVGRVVKVKRHPNADRIRLALVDLGIGEPVQIVFGGPPNVHEGDLVPVAPPGSRLPNKLHEMRRRRYRGESSYGMLCSLAELGWNPDAPDEVALLRNVTPGDSLDKVTGTDLKSMVINATSASDSNPIAVKPSPSMA
jgi:phenylalanyl-tRNA synthetase beta chain